jgi:maleylpyruvate isomerase
MKLHNYFRSGTSHRLRIALNLKGLTYEYLVVNLLKDEHFQDAFKRLNPQGFVPALEVDERVLTQSPAIIEWLEEKFPSPALLPVDLIDRQYVRSLAALIGCDIHPVNNRRILQKLRHDFNATEAQINDWCTQWISDGFDALEQMLQSDPSREGFCFGNSPTLADVYLIPQIESARRFNVNLSQWPNIQAIEKNCLCLDAFKNAAPGMQIDA